MAEPTQGMRVPETFYSLFTIARAMGIPKATVKNFSKESPPAVLAPIAHLFVCFEEAGRRTWAIKKLHFDRWRRTGKVPKVSCGRPPKWKDNPNLVNINIPFPKDLYEQFKKVVDKANSMSIIKVSYRDMFPVAVKEFVDRRAYLMADESNESGESGDK